MDRNQRFGNGFTLIELLIVIAIIAILALIAVPNFLEAQTRAQVARAMADMRSLATAMESMRLDRGVMLVDFWDDDQPVAWVQQRSRALGQTVSIRRDDRGGTVGVLVPLTTPVAYMTRVPEDPFAEANAAYPGFTDPYFATSPPPRSYVYIDNDPEIAGHDDGGISRGSFTEGAWVLISSGPTREYTHRDQYPLIHLYDPTNGTVSRGDIIYNSASQFDRYPGVYRQ